MGDHCDLESDYGGWNICPSSFKPDTASAWIQIHKYQLNSNNNNNKMCCCKKFWLNKK